MEACVFLKCLKLKQRGKKLIKISFEVKLDQCLAGELTILRDKDTSQSVRDDAESSLSLFGSLAYQLRPRSYKS